MATGIDVEVQHHEVGTAGQAEIDLRFDTLLKTADNLMKFKYIVKNVARDARPDGHLHAEAALRRQRLRHARPPEPVEGRRAPVLRRGRLRRALATWRATTSAACSSTPRRCWPSPNPTTNCYRRLVPGYEAPVNLVYSARNRSACCPHPDVRGKSRRPSASSSACPTRRCNPYLAFSALLMAGLDGIKNKIEPPAPVDKDLYELPPDELANGRAGAGQPGGGARGARGRPRVPARRATSSPRT